MTNTFDPTPIQHANVGCHELAALVIIFVVGTFWGAYLLTRIVSWSLKHWSK